MNGSLSYEEAWNTTADNRKLIRKVIQKIKKAESGGH
jgi:hypothetical protein